MSSSDADEAEAARTRAGSETATLPGDPEEWMRRDDAFLADADREYVLREAGRSWRAWLSPVLFGAGLVVLVGDAITVGVGTALGLETTRPVTAPVVAELGLGGLVLLKAVVAVVLLLLPGVTGNLRQTARAGLAGVVGVCLFAVVVIAWALLGTVG